MLHNIIPIFSHSKIVFITLNISILLIIIIISFNDTVIMCTLKNTLIDAISMISATLNILINVMNHNRIMNFLTK